MSGESGREVYSWAAGALGMRALDLQMNASPKTRMGSAFAKGLD